MGPGSENGKAVMERFDTDTFEDLVDTFQAGNTRAVNGVSGGNEDEGRIFGHRSGLINTTFINWGRGGNGMW